MYYNWALFFLKSQGQREMKGKNTAGLQYVKKLKLIFKVT